MRPVNLDRLPHPQMVGNRSGELLAASADVSAAIGADDVSIRHETIAPGHRASALHEHSHLTETVVVLAGQATLQWGDRTLTVAAGEAIAIRPGTGLHALRNDTGGRVTTLTVTVPHPDDAVRFE